MTMASGTKKGKQAFTDVIGRQWALLRLLPRSPRKATAAGLRGLLEAEGFAVTGRTVQRDLQTLSTAFAIENDERNKPYGWRWARDAPALSLPALSPAEALAFRLVRQFSAPLLPASVMDVLAAHFTAADRALSAAPDVARNWPAKVRIVHPTQVLKTPAIPPKVYADVTGALLHGRMLAARYGREGKEKRRELHPLALVQRGPVTYLVARASSFPDARLYVLHRFSGTQVLEQKANTAGFDVDAYLAGGALEFGDGAQIRLEALLERSAAQHLRESPLSDDQSLAEEPDGRVRLRATVRDTRQLRWWLLGFGTAAEVVKPPALRADFRGIARKLARAYG
jgi:predicted DNA-binding transcriptional regulator YafY